MTLGYIQMGLTGVGLLGAIPSWFSFSDKKSSYNDAYAAYLEKTTPEDVNFYREAARDKHDEMVSTKTQAIVFTIDIWLHYFIKVIIFYITIFFNYFNV